MKFTDLLARAWQILQDNILTYLLIAVSASAVNSFLLKESRATMPEPGMILQDASDFANSSGVPLVPFLISIAISLIAALLVTVLTDEYIKGNKLDFNALIQKSLPRAVPYVVALLLVSLIVALGAFLFIIPGIIFGIFLIFTGQAAALKNQKIADALRYSIKMVKGQWWNIFWINLGLLTINIFLSLIIGLIAGPNKGFIAALIPNTLVALVMYFYITAKTTLFVKLDI